LTLLTSVVGQVKEIRLKSKNCSPINKKVNFLPEQPIMYIKQGEMSRVSSTIGTIRNVKRQIMSMG
jgi:hypothetical protein